MGTTATTAPSRPKGVMGSWLWWRPDPGELERQVTQYASLNAFQSARGVSAILCVLTVGVTALFAQWIHLSATAVEIEAVVRADGTIDPRSIRIVRSLDSTFGLDREAIEAIKQWRFRPAVRKGQAVASFVTLELVFTLR